MLDINKDLTIVEIDLNLDYKIKDIALAEEGHKDMQLSFSESCMSL